MGKPSILIFFQVFDLEKQYEELFPYPELNNVFEIDKFGCLNNKPNRKKTIKIHSFTRIIHAFLHNCELRRRRFVTLSYLNRVNEYYPNSLDLKSIKIRSFNKANCIKRVAVFMFSNWFGVFFLQKILSALFYFESLLKAKSLKIFQLFILPYTGGISVEWDFLVWFGNKYKINSIAVQENWDNLSSKQFLIQFPRIFLVWGKQSGSHLRTYQLYQGKIIEVGCLRLQKLYEIEKVRRTDQDVSKLSSKKSQPTILYVDSGSADGDLSIVTKLSSYISTRADMTDKFKVIYRTHPKFNTDKSRTILINQIKLLPNIEVFEIEDESNSSRLQQLTDADIVISIFSTYVLEASILNKYCLIPTFDVEFENHSPQKLIDDVAHFHGVSMLDRVEVSTSFDSLIESLERFKTGTVPPPNDAKLLNWFCEAVDTRLKIFQVVNSCLDSKI